MLEVKIECKDIGRLQEMMAQMPKITDENIRKVLEAFLYETEGIAKSLAPVRTGRLRADISTTFNKQELQGVIYNKVNYAIYVHEGTRKMPARPYILNAIHLNKREVELQRQLQKEYLQTERGLI